MKREMKEVRAKAAAAEKEMKNPAETEAAAALSAAEKSSPYAAVAEKETEQAANPVTPAAAEQIGAAVSKASVAAEENTAAPHETAETAEQPASSGQPAVTEQPASPEPPANSEQPADSERPAPPEQPAGSEQSASAGQSADPALLTATEQSADPARPQKQGVWQRIWGWLKRTVPGVVLCALIAVPSWFLGKLVPVIGPAVFAIVIGMIIAFFRRPKWLDAGIRFTSKKVLQASIVFLGFGMNFFTVVQVGGDSLLIILSTIATSLLVSFIMYKILKTPANVATLVGVGSSICGGSAIAATSPVIRAKDSEVATSISVIFLFNVIAAFTFPAIGQALGMSDTGFGMWAGTAINDTSSVVAAGQSWASMVGNDTALQYATIVKLTRTLAIIPITLALALWQAIKAKRAAKAGTAAAGGTGFNFVKVFPWFVIFFLVAAVVNTWLFPAVGIGENVSDFLSEAGKFMIAFAMAAIGLNTNVVKLVKTGWKPILMGLACWVCIAGVSIGVQVALGLW